MISTEGKDLRDEKVQFLGKTVKAGRRPTYETLKHEKITEEEIKTLYQFLTNIRRLTGVTSMLQVDVDNNGGSAGHTALERHLLSFPMSCFSKCDTECLTYIAVKEPYKLSVILGKLIIEQFR